jgi:sporulation protein YlmC with PRC-barrel domain
MRETLLIGLLASVLVLAPSATMLAAGQPGKSSPEQPSSSPAVMDSDTMKSVAEPSAAKHALAGRVWRITDLIGMEVQGQGRDKLGKIENLAIDQETGKIRYVIVSFETTMGFGGKLMPAPWQAFKFVSATTAGETVPMGGVSLSGQMSLPSPTTGTAPYCILNADKDALAKAPGFDRGRWPDFNDRKWITAIEQFYRSYVAKQTEGSITR